MSDYKDDPIVIDRVTGPRVGLRERQSLGSLTVHQAQAAVRLLATLLAFFSQLNPKLVAGFALHISPLIIGGVFHLFFVASVGLPIRVGYTPGGQPPNTYLGNPNVTVSSITTDGVAAFGTITGGSACVSNCGNGATLQTASFDATGVGVNTTVTLPLASPGVVNWTGHGLATDQQISFFPLRTSVASGGLFNVGSSLVNWTGHGFNADQQVTFSGGTLPTGVVAFTTYYVSTVDTDHFQLCAAAGCGAGPIAFSGSSSGTQSGTATMPTGVVRDTVYYVKAGAGTDTFSICAAAGCAGGAINFTSTAGAQNGTGARIGSTNRITTSSPHGFSAGQRVIFTAGSGSLPTGEGSSVDTFYNTTFVYYVCVISSTEISVYVEWQDAYNCSVSSGKVLFYNAGSGTGNTITVTTMYFYNDVPLTTSSGSCGTGAIATVVLKGGAVTDLILQTPGSGYTANSCVLTANASDIGGVTGFTVPVTQVGIATSRTSGETPAFVQVSASGIGAAGNSTLTPFTDLEYHWNCGQAASENFTRPTDGVAVDANVDQVGPEAVCVYRGSDFSGTPKTITLTVKAWNGSSVITQQTTTTFTSSEFVPAAGSGGGGLAEWWFCPSASGAGSGDGKSAGGCFTAKDPQTNIAPLINSGATPKVKTSIHIQRGSGFVLGDNGGTSGIWSINIGINGLRIDDCSDYHCTAKFTGGAGGDVDPTLTNTTVSATPVLFQTNTKAKQNIVISNLAIVQSKNTLGCWQFTPADFTVAMDNIYLDRGSCDMTAQTNSVDALTFSGLSNLGVWGTSITQPDVHSVNNVKAIGGSLYHDWWFFVGQNLSGWGPGGGLEGTSHAFYIFGAPLASQLANSFYTTNHHILARWENVFDGSGKDNALKILLHQGGGFFVMDQNSATQIDNMVDINTDPNQRDNINISFYNIICSGNAFFNINGAQGTTCTSGTNFFTYTVRDNRSWAAGTNNPKMMEANVNSGLDLTMNMYRNCSYVANNILALNFQEATTTFGANYTYPNKQVITDNTFWANTASGRLVADVWSHFVTNGSVFARQKYYTQAASPFLDGATGKSFAAWQANNWDTVAQGSSLTTSGGPAGWNGGSAPTQWSDFGTTCWQ